MENPQQFVTMAEYLDMTERIQGVISTLGETTNALRTVTLLIVAALAKQDDINAKKFMDDISFMIENHYPPDAVIPTAVLDFRAELAKAIPTKA